MIMEMINRGRTHCLGTYFPRNHREHWLSWLSQAVVKAKKYDEREIDSFGTSIAQFLDGWFTDSYVITHVPAEISPVQWLFPDLGECVARQIATAVFRHLQKKDRATLAQALAVTGWKRKRQRQCHGNGERHKNVAGHYRVVEADLVTGRDIVLIDDVVTSGATMDECQKVLEETGASGVTRIALAETSHEPLWSPEDAPYSLY